MKRFCSLLLIVVLLLAGCAEGNYANVTPSLDAIDSISFQRTNVDEENEYTYFEKTLTEADDIEAFCTKIDKLKFVEIDPIKFSSVDYLIVFEGAMQHKLMVSGDEIIYDGLAYKIEKGSLKDAISNIYDGLTQQEHSAASKLFR